MESKYEQYVGQKIGHRTVLSIHPTNSHHIYFWCRCDCGHEGRVKALHLIRGQQISCGCKNSKKMIDLVGKKFGKWTVLSREENYTRKASKNSMRMTSTRWLCQCDCGSIAICMGGNLRSGKTIGCLKCKKYNESVDGGITSKYNQVKAGSVQGGHIWNLNQLLWEDLTSQDCFYCGNPPHQKHLRKTYNGLDRYDNDAGYCDQNVVPCCWTCNKLKRSLHGDDFLKQIFQIAQNKA